MANKKHPRILFIHPAALESPEPYAYIPAGIISSLNNLKKNSFEIYAINEGLELSLEPSYDIIDDIKNFNPDILLTGIHWYEHLAAGISLARKVKKLFPGLPVVTGGMTASFFQEKLLHDTDCFDAVITGEAEETLLILASEFSKHGLLFFEEPLPGIATKNMKGNMRPAPPASLAGFDFVNIEWLKNSHLYYSCGMRGLNRDRKYRSFILANARGCNMNCIFCGGSRKAHLIINNRESLASRPPAEVAGDVLLLWQRGVDQLRLTHDPEIIPGDWATFFLDEVEKLFSDTALSSTSNHDDRPGLYTESWHLPSENFLKRLADIFNSRISRIQLTPLSGDEKVREINGKCFTDEEFYAILYLLNELEIPFDVFFTLNPAGETEESVEATFNMMRRIVEISNHELVSLFYLPVVPDPCSRLYELAGKFREREKGKIFSCFEDFLIYSGSKRTLEKLSRPDEPSLVEKEKRFKKEFGSLTKSR